MMVELLILLSWMGAGVGAVLISRPDERGAASFAGGVLLGPLWWVIVVDRRALASLQPSMAIPAGGPNAINGQRQPVA